MKPAAVVLSLLWFGALLGPVYAQPAPSAVEADKTASDRADELVKKGNVFARLDHWSDAEPLYREAWSLKRSYDIAGNLGVAEAALGKNRDAAEHLRFAIKSFPANGKSEHRKLLEATLAKARAEVAALAIQSSVEKAEVFVDGKSAGIAPLGEPVFVAPGTHTIESKLAGYATASRSVETSKGGAVEVTLAMSVQAPPVATIAPIATVTPVVPPRGPNKAIVFTGAGVAGAALIAGVVFTVLANGSVSTAREKTSSLITATGSAACAQPSKECQQIAGPLQDWTTFKNGAAWSFIGAGTLGVATVVYALVAKSSPKASMHAAPVMTASGGGFVVGGAW